ncbi:MAG: hypothetical protein AAGC77_13475, partial [Pseudomonadota bacterium]
ARGNVRVRAKSTFLVFDIVRVVSFKPLHMAVALKGENMGDDRWFLDRIATHVLAFEGDSHVEWFEGNYADYVEDKKRRLGADSDVPTRIKYKPLTR